MERRTTLKLKDTLDNPAQAQYFAEFLQGEYNCENLMFYVNCNQLLTLEAQPQIDKVVEEIYDKFIPTDSELAINIPFQVQDEIMKTIRAGPPFSREIFVKAQSEAFQNMRSDPFPRFLKSVCYSTVYASTVNSKPAVEIPIQIFEEILKDADESVSNGWGNLNEKDGIRYTGWHSMLTV